MLRDEIEQAIRDAAERYGVTNPFNIQQNIMGGTHYLADLINEFKDLRLAVMEIRYSCVMAANNTLAQVEHTERRLTETQKRFDRACESLARVRKLSRPSVQINVATEGGRQLNVA